MKIEVNCSTGEAVQQPLSQADLDQQVADAQSFQAKQAEIAAAQAAAAQRRADLDAIIAQYRSKSVIEPINGGKPA